MGVSSDDTLGSGFEMFGRRPCCEFSILIVGVRSQLPGLRQEPYLTCAYLTWDQKDPSCQFGQQERCFGT